MFKNDDQDAGVISMPKRIKPAQPTPSGVDAKCCHNWHDYGQVNRSWCPKCDAVAVTGYEEAPYAALNQAKGEG